MRSIAVLSLFLLLSAATQPLRSQATVRPVSAQDDSEQNGVSSNVSSSYLGVAVVPLDDEMSSELKLRDGQGALVRWVAEGSPASKAGIRPNDIILQFNGHDINDVSDLGRFVHQASPGRKAKLRMIRDGKAVTILVTPGTLRAPSAPVPGSSIRLDLAAPDFFTSDMPLPALFWRSNFLGIEYESIDSQLAGFFGVKHGLLVRYVLDRSAAQASGLRAGDVLVKVANRQCASPRDIGQAIRNRANPDKPIPLEIVRDHKTRALVLNLPETRNQPSPE